jgi:hypothetical protein
LKAEWAAKKAEDAEKILGRADGTSEPFPLSFIPLCGPADITLGASSDQEFVLHISQAASWIRLNSSNKTA